MVNSHWNVNELHKVTDETHNPKTNGDSFAYLRELWYGKMLTQSK